MNQVEAARLAAAMNALRPDWPSQSLMSFLHQVAAWPYRDAALQLTWLACDPETETPARLLTEGPWRKLTRLVDGGMPQPHPYQPSLGLDREPLTDAEREAAAKAAEKTKQALAQVIGTAFCHHCNKSVPRGEIVSHDCGTESKESETA